MNHRHNNHGVAPSLIPEERCFLCVNSLSADLPKGLWNVEATIEYAIEVSDWQSSDLRALINNYAAGDDLFS